jgi:hypothetical protein
MKVLPAPGRFQLGRIPLRVRLPRQPLVPDGVREVENLFEEITFGNNDLHLVGGRLVFPQRLGGGASFLRGFAECRGVSQL